MTAPHPNAYESFLKFAREYNGGGRAACLCGSVFIAGNLLHHAVEMLLKGELSKTVAMDDLKDKYGHWLPKCWSGFKALFPAEDLSEFDPMIVELDRFEQIRYPNKLLKNGASIGIGFCRGRVILSSSMERPVPQYQMGVGDVDAFFARAMPLCHMNPRAYFCLTAEGKEILRKYNDFAEKWLK